MRPGTFMARSVTLGAAVAGTTPRPGTTLLKFGGTRPPGITGGRLPIVPTFTVGANPGAPTPATGGRGATHPAGPCTTGTAWKLFPYHP